MTREEAAIIIKKCKEKGFKHTFYTLNEYHTALDVAIQALEQEPCEDLEREYQKTKALFHKVVDENDAISRQAAIDACNQSINLFEAVDRIKELSSIRPKAESEG